MSWVIAGTAIGTAALGAINASQQRKAQQQANETNANMSAAQMQYSPWTGVKPSTPQMGAVTDNVMGGALQGGLGGAMFGSALQKNLGESAAKKSAAGDELEKEFDAMPEQQAQSSAPPTYGPQSYEQFYGKPNPNPGGPMFGPPTAQQFYGKKTLR